MRRRFGSNSRAHARPIETSTISRKDATAQLAMLLACARPEIRRTFTVDWLQRRYNVPRSTIENMLGEAREPNLDDVKLDD